MDHMKTSLSGLSVLVRLGLDRAFIGGSVLLALVFAAHLGGV